MQLVSIAVSPADATIAVESGVAMPLTYSAVGTFADGHQAPIADATFALDDAAQKLAALSGAQLTASGTAAGKGQVSASSGGVTGATSVTVTVHDVHVDPSAPADAPTKFSGAAMTGSFSPLIDYPLDGAVMPSTVKAPDVQWEGNANAGDLYRVKLVAGGATVESYLANAAGFTFESQPLAADWALLLASSNGQPIAVTVDHYDPQTGVQGSQAVSVRPITANVTGVIYYWDLSEGKMQRLDASGRALAIPSPPVSPNPSEAGDRCVACHEISRDGRYLAAELWGGGDGSAVFDLSSPNINSDPAPTLAPLNSYSSLFATFNPDASRLLINSGNALGLIDPKNGMSLATSGTPLPTANAAHPTWSPDGSLIAFITNTDGPWAVDYTQGDVATIPVTGPDTFGPAQTLVASSTGDPAFKAPSWPSFTPDSQFIAYAAGTNSRGRNSVGTPPTEVVYPGALFLVNRSGGAPVKLDGACSSQSDCYLPNFSPYDSGGYFWMVFYSLRDYGNAQAGTKGTKRRQLWVTAIDKSKLGSGDPSSVPYWLPDQDPKTENMSAFWAVPPPLQ
jgi:hypothetical protein